MEGTFVPTTKVVQADNRSVGVSTSRVTAMQLWMERQTFGIPAPRRLTLVRIVASVAGCRGMCGLSSILSERDAVSWK